MWLFERQVQMSLGWSEHRIMDNPGAILVLVGAFVLWLLLLRRGGGG